MQRVLCCLDATFISHNYKNVKMFQLHGFRDAIKHPYAAVVYLRMTMDNSIVVTSLVASKTKVVPLIVRSSKDGITTPWLQLLACVLLYKLIKTILISLKGVLDIAIQVYCWTDSMDCIYLITNTSKGQKRFVQRRVQNVQIKF